MFINYQFILLIIHLNANLQLDYPSPDIQLDGWSLYLKDRYSIFMIRFHV